MRLALHAFAVVYLINGHQSLTIDQLREDVLAGMLQLSFGFEGAPSLLGFLFDFLLLFFCSPLVNWTEVWLAS